jgi:hypothetical protein
VDKTELHVYDFDDTLFRSPRQPEGLKGDPWWTDPRSLEEPCVPAEPGGEWWIGPVVASAKRSIADPDVMAVLMTGRWDAVFRQRVEDLLRMKGLDFAEVHLAPQEGSTDYFKATTIKDILRQHPAIKKVRFWDDNTKNLKLFKAEVEARGLEVEVNPIEVAPQRALCTPESMVTRVAYRWLLRAGGCGRG